MSMSVWMEKTARASFAASRSVKEEHGEKDASTYICLNSMYIHVYFFPPLSCFSMLSTGWHIFTFSTLQDSRQQFNKRISRKPNACNSSVSVYTTVPSRYLIDFRCESTMLCCPVWVDEKGHVLNTLQRQRRITS